MTVERKLKPAALGLFRRALRISRLFKDPQVGKRFVLNWKDAIRLYSNLDQCHGLGRLGKTKEETLEYLIQRGKASLDTFEKLLNWDLARIPDVPTPMVYFNSKAPDIKDKGHGEFNVRPH